MKKSALWCVLLAGLLLLPVMVLADSDHAKSEMQDGMFEGKFGLGYRAVSYDELGRATEYRAQEPSLTGLLELKSWKDHTGLTLVADLVNENDFDASLDANLLRGHLRFWADAEKFVHNLDHYQLAPSATVDPVLMPTHPGASSGVPWVESVDRDSGERYRLEVNRNRVALKAKPNYPAHLILEAWQMRREGEKSLRYLEKADNAGACGQCHVNSRAQKVDQTINELKGSIDAHLGYVDVIIEQLYREFKNDSGPAIDSFAALNGGTLRPAGNYQHDDSPESTLLVSTLRLHSSLSGGLTAAGSVSLGKRENQSQVSDVQGISAKSDYLKTATDLGWIISPSWNLSAQYRWLDLDNSNSNSLVSAGQTVLVREAMDQRRAQYRFMMTHRPCRQSTVKWTYVHEDIERNRTTDDPANPWLWKLPGTESSDKYRMELLLNPFADRSMKLDAWYEFQSADEVAYGNSIKKGQEAFLGLSYNPSRRWGGVINVQGAEFENSEKTLALLNETLTSPAYQRFDLDRSESSLRANGTLWWNLDSLTVSTFLSWMTSQVEQDMVFGSRWNPDPMQSFVVVAENADSRQQVKSGSLHARWQVVDSLAMDTAVRHTRSSYRFNPEFADVVLNSLPVSAEGVGEISSFTVYQNSLEAGLTWQPVPNWNWSARYSVDDYDSRDDDLYDGTVQSVLVSLQRRW